VLIGVWSRSSLIDTNIGIVKMTKKAFIAYDFDIKKGLADRLFWVRENAGSDFEVDYPDAIEGRSQGEIWRDIVRPRIDNADRVIAYVDLPNANVGFEIGYALGAIGQKEVALARVREKRPEWLERPPLKAFSCPRVFDASKILDLVRGEDWVKAPRRPNRGSEALLLCPADGFVYIDLLMKKYPNWRTLPSDGWTITDLPEKLSNVGAVIWLIVPHEDGESERDGRGNAAASVVAGFAAGLNLPIRVFVHKDSSALSRSN
jgi:hypothetical protein